ncbi:GntR family transcriptional regulator [Clostridium sp.]|uniref:GntR family transcriptional regulator n=1 Tax=Clostridium sp. TaxID=1506 RepID=UPI003992583C
MIDKNSPIPAYYQIKQIILEKINNNEWKVGQCIASERELSEAYGVSRMTVRQALGELVQEGILFREKGKGTFVCEPKVTQKDMMSFSEIISKSGKSLKNEVIEFGIVDTPEELGGVFPQEKLYRINRNRVVDDIVIANEEVYIPYEYCGDITKKQVEGSLFTLLESLNYSVDYSESSIKSVLMDENLKKIFKVNSEVPLLQSDNRVYSDKGILIFVEKAIYRSDKYVLEVNISKREGKVK